MKKITVTSPLLPPLNELTPYLEDIWKRKWLTNNGHYHQQLEKELCNYLGVKYISLFSNGTLALVTALQALELKGEVITTPYSFVATSHAIMFNNLTPVFVDIDPHTFNLDPNKIEAAITDKTSAILPVHVYGTPCNHDEIQRIANKYNLKIIYDAAHAFGVEKNNTSILNWGDLSILSFHATKAYSTVEGGAIICHSAEMKQKLDRLKNFGYESELEISMLGSNAKMNEIQAAFGLVSLSYIDRAIIHRKKIAETYKSALKDLAGLNFISDNPDVKLNYSYFPIIIDEKITGISRDQLYEKLKNCNVLSRRYFYPLITDFDFYKNTLASKKIQDISIAKRVSDNVICLPIHHSLTEKDVIFISEIISTEIQK
ncbi:DegT/DnrJ/EryC1/StrS family aminotransferase [Providencia alcalifaciens]|uniref:DegT/DnrJ/EryC1/StrS family aminotransferase n=1 Tax=Providencia alcalifaciens TaxID=126385 RepID=UPI001CC3E83A|nr:DegT/DnrJ/EryC1/StrS family aminotransferase [Providencia alcalifaciens]CAG9431319.1 dTDP-4-amino-4,6-dideoxy-D-glucose transaminase [Providencia alcalifaciens]CAG9434458.1 dTDP-4-amino-4,6-dideoxy-D-glucose transaminase [Providencia alcalifaciens]CAG9434564.1 dTDP-4-amino-4,6-dideoxy-D-glucose transaminase [Providencia alcalifaciens]CAG9435054.1 dTDP-4-amino-4,6-dideoxy-D-glucose transaminase [Providencia alcalifaciens]CAG9435131.1 dTDP-4-amino-4,6-dideoxy-D-glucose transaminase [Providenc